MFASMRLGLGCMGSSTFLPATGGIGPTNLAISANSTPESAAAGLVVGTLTCTAPGDIVTWSLTDDAGGRFVIGGDDDDQVLVNWAQFDRTVATSYNITVRATGLSGYTEAVFAIAISDVVDPGELDTLPSIAGNVRASGRYTLSGSLITAFLAQWGATGGSVVPVAGEEPALISAGGPAAQTVARCPVGDAPGVFTAVTGLTTFEFVADLAPEDTTGNLVLLSHTSNTANFFQLVDNGATGTYNRLAFRASANGANVNIALNPVLYPGRFHKIRLRGDGVNVTFWIDDVQAGTSASASGTYNFSRLGKLNVTANPTNYQISDFALYAAALSAGNVASIESWLEPGRRQRRFTADDGSDSSTTPWLQATPLLTVAQAKLGLRPGDAVLFARGDTWRNQQITNTVTGTEAAPIVWGAYGSGNDPRLWGVTTANVFTSGWTDAGAGDWTRTLAYRPTKVWIPLAHNNGQLWDFDLSSDFTITEWYFDHDGVTTLTIHLNGVLDPNTIEVVVAEDNTLNGVDTAATFNRFEGLDLRYWARTGVSCGGTGQLTMKGGFIAFCAADGVDMASSGTMIVLDAEISGVGVNRFAGSSDGDGISGHGTCAVVVKRCYLHDNLKSGVLSLRSTTNTVERCLLQGNNQNLDWSDTGTGNGSATYRNNIVIRTADDQAEAINVLSGAGTLTVDIEFNTIVSSEAGIGTGINLQTGAATYAVTALNNIIRGFAVGSASAAGKDLTENYNDYFGNTTARTGGHNGGSATPGVNDISSDPDMVDFNGGDYALTVDSPCIGAADNTGVTVDYLGLRRGPGYDIGAYQYSPLT